MRRDLDKLEATVYDLVIVGGGIYGACAAREAALQGLSVCLLERGDFGCATSANSLKIIHGGLRYLQNLDLKRMRESIRERRTLGYLAPHLVRPMPFAIPCYGHLLRGREVMGVALALNEIISWDRNKDLPADRRVPRGRLLSKNGLESIIPDLPDPGLIGGAIWYDGLARNTERLLLAFVKGAVAAGAHAANYVEVREFRESGSVVDGVRATDRIGGRSVEVRGRMVLNAAGPWVDSMLARLSCAAPRQHFQMSKGMNLVTRQIFPDCGAAIPFQSSYDDEQAVLDKGKLHFFIVPWKQYSLIGTRHLPWNGSPDSFRVTEEDVEAYLDEINAAYPPARLRREDVARVYEGMLPAVGDAEANGDVQIGKQFTITDHAASDGVDGLVTMVGVKWTTARHVAEQAVKVVLRKLGRKPSGDSARIPLPGGDFSDWSALVDRLTSRAGDRIPTGIVARLAESYGTEAEVIIDDVLAEPELAGVLEGGSPTLAAELRYAVREEMAEHLVDLVLRRTELATGSDPGAAVLAEAARLMGMEHDWDDARQGREIEAALAAIRHDAPPWSAPSG